MMYVHMHCPTDVAYDSSSLPPPPPRVCFRGIVLKDLVAIDTQTKDLVDPAQQTINMNKYRLLSTSLSAIRQAQLSPPKVSSDLDRIRIMRVRAAL